MADMGKSIVSLLFAGLVLMPILARADDAIPKTPIEIHGALSVQGNRIVDAHGTPVALRGMGLFVSQWISKYYNEDAIKWLRDDWHCDIIRVPMGVENDGGYLQNPDVEQRKVTTVVQAAIDLGMYVIIDWHDDHSNLHVDQSKAFFDRMASTYGKYPNVIFEPWNEPLKVKWATVVKPYHEAVIPVIRAYSNNLIICGTPTWSQDVDIAAKDPIAGPNIAYTLHFYAATHKESLRRKAALALKRGAAIFVTEWGVCEASGNGKFDMAETQKWLDFMDQNKIGWCNFSIGDKAETSASLLPGAAMYGGWPATTLTASGILMRGELRKEN
ncbi:MAG TPA: glycoside hydrolase family 5 protein [Tepidisphaeraceae bacterium]|jgi:endoglucanase